MRGQIGLFSETSLAERRDLASYYKDLGAQIVLADQLGFDFFSATQSFGRDYPDTTFSITPDPIGLFTNQIERTTRIKMLTAILIAPFQHPAMALSQAAFADVLSEGRMMLGIGRGHPWLYERLGFSQEDSRARFEEFCSMARTILDDQHARHTLVGQFWEMDDFELMPQFESPDPPVFVAQVSGRSTADIAVNNRFGLLIPSYLGVPLEQVVEVSDYYRQQYQQRWGSNGQILVGVQVFADSSEGRAVEIGARALARQLGVFSRNLNGMAAKIGAQYPAYGPLGEFFAHMAHEDICRQTVEKEWPRFLAVWGDAEGCLAKLKTLTELTRPDGLILNVDAGGLAHADVESAMQLLGNAVLPDLRAVLDQQLVDPAPLP